MSRLTSRTLASGASLNDLIHIVITGDTTQNPDGSSFKATLSQLVPLFSGSTDTYITGGTYNGGTSTITLTNNTGGTVNVTGITTGTEVFITGGTANSTGGTMTFTNSTGGTFNVTGTTKPFSGGSDNCISGLYVTRVYGCADDITIYDRIQSDGSDAQGTLSFAFGSEVNALSSYSHAEGRETIASGTSSHAEGYLSKSFGDYSHVEGYQCETGTNEAYSVTGITSGVTYLDPSYGDKTLKFEVDKYMPITHTGGTFNYSFKISASTYNGSQTIIYLYDTTYNSTATTAGGSVGSLYWDGDRVMGGLYASAKGYNSHAINWGSTAINASDAYGVFSFAGGNGSSTYGAASISVGSLNVSYGDASSSFGTGNVSEGNSSFTVNGYNYAGGNWSFAGGTNSKSMGTNSFTHGNRCEVYSTQSAVLGGSYNLVTSGISNIFDSAIIGGSGNTVTGSRSVILGGYSTSMSGTSNDSGIIGGSGNTLTGARSVMLGGVGMVGTNNDTVYVPNFVIVEKYTPSGSADVFGELGSITWDDNDNIYFKNTNGWIKVTGVTF